MKRDSKYPNTYWNHGNMTITLVIQEKPDPKLGFGFGDYIRRIFIGPGDGINFDSTDLKPWKPDSDMESR